MLGLLAREVPAAQLHEVRRFEAPWEREASVRLRDGDLAAVAAYDRHGRIRAPMRKPPTSAPRRCGSPITCAARTCCCWPGPTPKPPNSPGGSRPGSRARHVGPPQAALADGNHAGTGDLVRARLNTEIDAGGRSSPTATP